MCNFGVMKIYRLLYMVVCGLAAMLAACGHSDSFKVKGTMAGGESINLRFVYYTAGGVRTGLTASTDGKFEFEGFAPELAAVEVYDNEYRLLGRFVAVNGDDIDLRIDRRNMYREKVTGNEINKALTEFYNANADALAQPDSPVRNRIVADYVAANPGSVLSQLLIVTEIDASSETGALMADSLTSVLMPEARVLEIAEPFTKINSRVTDTLALAPITAITYKARGNRTATFATQRKGLSVIAVSDGTHGRDSVLEAIRELARHEKEGRFALLDLSVDTDTLVWTRSIRNDSATWEQGWAAGAISGQSLDRLGIPFVPYFILTDSTGRQLWRGRSAKEIVSRTMEEIKTN